MLKRFVSQLLATGFVVFVSTTASAGLLSIDLITGEIPESLVGALPLGASHDVVETKGTLGWYYANLSATQNVTLTYEYLGFEAGWTNSLVVDDSQVFWNYDVGSGASTPGDTTTSSASAGTLLDFAFAILSGGNAGLGVVNGANNYPINTINVPNTGHGAPNFFLGYVPDSGYNSVYIALDDGGGAPWKNNSIDDDNHDDLVIKVTAVAVPEPGTLSILGLGLLGLGFSRWRRVR